MIVVDFDFSAQEICTLLYMMRYLLGDACLFHFFYFFVPPSVCGRVDACDGQPQPSIVVDTGVSRPLKCIITPGLF